MLTVANTHFLKPINAEEVFLHLCLIYSFEEIPELGTFDIFSFFQQ